MSGDPSPMSPRLLSAPSHHVTRWLSGKNILRSGPMPPELFIYSYSLLPSKKASEMMQCQLKQPSISTLFLRQGPFKHRKGGHRNTSTLSWTLSRCFSSPNMPAVSWHSYQGTCHGSGDRHHFLKSTFTWAQKANEFIPAKAGYHIFPDSLSACSKAHGTPAVMWSKA